MGYVRAKDVERVVDQSRDAIQALLLSRVPSMADKVAGLDSSEAVAKAIQGEIPQSMIELCEEKISEGSDTSEVDKLEQALWKSFLESWND